MRRIIPIVLGALAGAHISLCGAATWYVDASVAESGDGASCDTAFKTIQEGVDAAAHGDRVIVAEGLYVGTRFQGKRIAVLSTNPFDLSVVGNTVMDGLGWTVVVFSGTEDQTCLLSGFTIRGGGHGVYGNGTRATIQNNIITDNWTDEYGGGILRCDGLIQNNIICYNLAGHEFEFWPGYGGGLYECNGTIRNNTIVSNWVKDAWVYEGNYEWRWEEGLGGALFACKGTIENCIIWDNSGPEVQASSDPIASLVGMDPQFLNEANRDFRLRPGSPCIDAGYNSADLPEFDTAGLPRIMFGGKSLTVDIGAYEFFYTGVQKGPGADEATLVWSFVPDKSYSIVYTDDLFIWHTAIDNFPSSGNQTTSWLDDGCLTGVPPLLAPKRFYRILENP